MITKSEQKTQIYLALHMRSRGTMKEAKGKNPHAKELGSMFLAIAANISRSRYVFTERLKASSHRKWILPFSLYEKIAGPVVTSRQPRLKELTRDVKDWFVAEEDYSHCGNPETAFKFSGRRLSTMRHTHPLIHSGCIKNG